MLVVKVELHPFGDSSNKKNIRTIVIGNDGSGDSDTANYSVFMGCEGNENLHEIIHHSLVSGRVEGYNRGNGAISLVAQAIHALEAGEVL